MYGHQSRLVGIVSDGGDTHARAKGRKVVVYDHRRYFFLRPMLRCIMMCVAFQPYSAE